MIYYSTENKEIYYPKEDKEKNIDLNELSKCAFKLISDISKKDMTPFDQDLLKRKLIDEMHNLEFSLRADFYKKENFIKLLNIALQLVYLYNINLNEVYNIKLK